MFLLDTNHCSGLLMGNPTLLEKLSALGDPPLSSCTIVVGELVDMAARSRDRQTNLIRVQQFFAGLHIYPCDSETAEIYGVLKADFFRRYGPKDKRQRRRTTINQLGIGDNDLWIAAITLQHNLTLVTADSDFQRLPTPQPLPIESWL
ncbi:MAG: type II toxin-antitoxin system VapC family toxin [Cyanobacteria bacterium P01_C01_bin.89]